MVALFFGLTEFVSRYIETIFGHSIVCSESAHVKKNVEMLSKQKVTNQQMAQGATN